MSNDSTELGSNVPFCPKPTLTRRNGWASLPKWAEVPSAAKAVLTLADKGCFWSVFYSLPATWRKVEGSTHVVVRGWSGERQFMAVWEDGKADCAYWWTREHRAEAKLPDEVIEWTSLVPAPVKVSFVQLKTLLKECGKV